MLRAFRKCRRRGIWRYASGRRGLTGQIRSFWKKSVTDNLNRQILTDKPLTSVPILVSTIKTIQIAIYINPRIRFILFSRYQLFSALVAIHILTSFQLVI